MRLTNTSENFPGGVLRLGKLHLRLYAIAACLFTAPAAWPQRYDISTVAGGPQPLAVSMPALGAEVEGPFGVAVDASGNIYFTDGYCKCVNRVDASGTLTRVAIDAGLYTGVAVDGSGNLYYIAGDYRIRRVATDGIITNVAGTGVNGHSGDGGPATSAQLFFPSYVAIDASGNLYITEYGRIRKVSAGGTITTVAGTGVDGYSGDGGPAIKAALYSARGIAVDRSGNLYIAELGNRVRRVSADGTITTVAGTGRRGYSGDGGPAINAMLNQPNGLAVDGSGNLYIADLDNHVRRVSAAGIITTVAGAGGSGYSGDGGPAITAQLNYPAAVAADGFGNLYIADYDNHRIRKVSPGGIISSVAGGGTGGDGGPAIKARLANPSAVAVDGSGNLYIADAGSWRIRKVSTDGIITTIAGIGIRGFSDDGIPATGARLLYPIGVAVDAPGSIYILEFESHYAGGSTLVRKVAPDGLLSTAYYNFSDESWEFSWPSAIALDIAGSLYVADPYAGQIVRISAGGANSRVAGTSLPVGIAVDGAGNVYIAAIEGFRDFRVWKVSKDGIITPVAGGGRSDPGDDGPAMSVQFSNLAGVAADELGNLYILDGNRVRKISANGIITTIAGTVTSGYSGDGGPATSAQFNRPRGIWVDPTGQKIFVADSGNNAIRVLQAMPPVVAAGAVAP